MQDVINKEKEYLKYLNVVKFLKQQKDKNIKAYLQNKELIGGLKC